MATRITARRARSAPVREVSARPYAKIVAPWPSPTVSRRSSTAFPAKPGCYLMKDAPTAW